jgi:hypothetical protein
MMSLESALITSGISATPQQAQVLIHSMTKQIYEDGANPEMLLEEIGLESDYIFDLIF